MATIAVVTSSPPFAEGGHLVMARELVRALKEEGHQAGLIVTPQNRFGRQASAYLAAWCTDVQLAHEDQKVDQVISLRFPGYAVQHPNHVLWLNHRMREYYDLWEQFSSHLSWKGKIKERTRRAIIHRVDNHLLGKMQRRFVISGTVQTRLRRFGGIQSDVLYPPPPKRDYRNDRYGDYLFGVSRLSPLKRFDLVLRALAEPRAGFSGSPRPASSCVTPPASPSVRSSTSATLMFFRFSNMSKTSSKSGKLSTEVTLKCRWPRLSSAPSDTPSKLPCGG